jgi:radical SAM protein (TIGR04043 family)
MRGDTAKMTESKSFSVARIKAELQDKGIRIAPELVKKLEARYNAPAVSTGRIVICLESPRGDGELIPVFIVNGKRGANSSYELVETRTGAFEVRKDNKQYTKITIIPRPKFYDRLTSGGVPMGKVAVIVGPGHLRSVVDQRCIYQQTGQACKFCAVQYWWNAAAAKQREQIAETVLAGYTEGAVKHISLTTATIDTPDRGLDNLVKTAELIHDKAKIPMMMEFEPLTDHALLKSLLNEAKTNGVTTISINIECFDRKLSADIMPAKGKIPFNEYTDNWKIALDIFGRNNVFTVAVAGTGEDDASIMKGVETAASLGVITYLVPHSPATGAVFEDMAPPGTDRMLALYEKASEIYRRYGLDICASAAGCVRGGGFSAIKDAARFGV